MGYSRQAGLDRRRRHRRQCGNRLRRVGDRPSRVNTSAEGGRPPVGCPRSRPRLQWADDSGHVRRAAVAVDPLGRRADRGPGGHRGRHGAAGARTDVAAQFLILAPLLVRRLWPIAVLVVVGVLAGLTSMQTPTPWIQVGTVALASYTVGDLSTDRLRGALTALFVSAMISLALLAQDANASQAVVFPLVVLVPAWLRGRCRPSAPARRHRASRGRANGRSARRRSGSARPWPRSAGRWPASCTTSWRTGSS